MSEENTLPFFKPPDNPDTKIWRYMDFAKFVSMLEHGGLFFPRSDALGDFFEGSFTNANLEEHKELMKTWSPEDKKAFTEFMKMYETNREWMMISCWHVNEDESATMWHSYTRTNESICIQSTVARLKHCLNDTAYIGLVRYEDYRTYKITLGNIFYPFVHKRRVYKSENELRAIIREEPLDEFDEPAPTGGIMKQLDLDALIERIYVAPNAHLWFRDLVAEIVLNKYGLDKPVLSSSLDERPALIVDEA